MIKDVLCLLPWLWMGKLFNSVRNTREIGFWVTYSEPRGCFQGSFIMLLNCVEVVWVNLNFLAVFVKFWAKFRAGQGSASRTLNCVCSNGNFNLFVWFLDACFLFERNEFLMTSKQRFSCFYPVFLMPYFFELLNVLFNLNFLLNRDTAFSVLFDYNGSYTCFDLSSRQLSELVPTCLLRISRMHGVLQTRLSLSQKFWNLWMLIV